MLKDLTTIEIPSPVVNSKTLNPFKISSVLREKLKEILGDKGYVFGEFTSYVVTDREKADVPAKYAVMPNQYLVFACELFEFSKELNKYFEIFDKLRPYSKFLMGNAESIKTSIITNAEILNHFNNDVDNEDIVHFSEFVATDSDKNRFRFGAKRLFNDQGKPRSSKDCFGSVILKVSNLPDSSSSIFGQLVYDLVQSETFFEELHNIYANHNNLDLNVSDLKVIRLNKPFILLAGISGTGKSRFIRRQAFKPELFCSVAVRPDWHEPSDLLGYVSRLSGTPEYHATDVLSFFVKAWINACDLSETTGIKLANVTPANMETYWLCLDEMNLAPVEQYFADYLSVIETRGWEGDEYTCAPLLKAETFSCLESAELGKLRTQLGINDALYDSMWSYFVSVGIPIPPNLIVAGTVNMDETTHGFSRKVIDRALTFDFGKFFPNDFDQYLEPKVRAKSFSFPTLSKVTKDDLSALAFDAGGARTIEFCKELNEKLKNSSFELAFRALNELLISLVCINPKDESELQAVWDDFLMTKVLPRIEGDADKLSVIGKNEKILNQLETLLNTRFTKIQSERPDFFRENIDGTDLKIPCRSIEKLKWMKDRLENATFTSFWP
jgi:hypothetical protein